MNIIYPFKKSVLFFTFHKCANTLFNDYVIPNIKGYIHVSPDSDIYNSKVNENCTFYFSNPFITKRKVHSKVGDRQWKYELRLGKNLIIAIPKNPTAILSFTVNSSFLENRLKQYEKIVI